MQRRSRVRMIEVARAAGVSHSTASRALNGHAKVSGAARDAVERAARELGYVRDLRAADLASSQTTTVGLLIRAAERPFYGALAARVQEHTEQRNHDLLTVSGGDDVAHQIRAVETLLGHGVGGILIASGRAAAEAVEYATSFVPTITMGLGLVRAGMDAVNIAVESEQALARAVAAAGHRRVAVTASSNQLAYALHARTANFVTSLVLADVHAMIVPLRGDSDERFDAELRAALAAGATAVMAGEDLTAFRVMEKLREWGLRCPEDVSVTGFDGVGAYRSSLVGLTTVTQPVEQMAGAAVDLLQTRLAGGRVDTADLRFAGELVTGRTLGPPPDQARG